MIFGGPGYVHGEPRNHGPTSQHCSDFSRQLVGDHSYLKMNAKKPPVTTVLADAKKVSF